LVSILGEEVVTKSTNSRGTDKGHVLNVTDCWFVTHRKNSQFSPLKLYTQAKFWSITGERSNSTKFQSVFWTRNLVLFELKNPSTKIWRFRAQKHTSLTLKLSA
jgi:hypothetical protein